MVDGQVGGGPRFSAEARLPPGDAASPAPSLASPQISRALDLERHPSARRIRSPGRTAAELQEIWASICAAGETGEIYSRRERPCSRSAANSGTARLHLLPQQESQGAGRGPVQDPQCSGHRAPSPGVQSAPHRTPEPPFPAPSWVGPRGGRRGGRQRQVKLCY